MSFANYTELKDSVQSWLADRTDLNTKVDDFLKLCEADINSLPDFRLKDQETIVSLTPSSSVVTLPTDYLEWRQVTLKSSPRRNLTFVAPSTVEQWYADRASSPGNHFTVIGSSLYVYPLITDQVELIYYAKVPALSATATTNWLLTKKPNVYLFGTLRYAGVYEQDDEMTQRYGGLYSAAMMELIAADRGARYARTAQRQSGPTS